MATNTCSRTVLAGILAATLAGQAKAGSTKGPAPNFDAIVKTYIDQDATTHPVGATSSGLHAGDAVMDDQSARAHRVRSLFLPLAHHRPRHPHRRQTTAP